jgi:dTDP-4-amino-4,6-dideoxygalactose transaminase
MSWRSLPPAGNPISLLVGGELPSFQGYRAIWVNSGTAALALALTLARLRQPHIDLPEVVVPGYGCPDLIAAALHAGVCPVLCDVGPHDPGYDLGALESAISANTIAVVAVNFLGIRERLEDIRQILVAKNDALLIEDDAQWFPEPTPEMELAGDAVCLSFGRGKPVSLLGGGALLLRSSILDTHAADSRLSSAGRSGSGVRWKVQAYNWLLQPWLYGPLVRSKLIGLGRTELRSLECVRELDAERRRLLPPNVHRYLNSPSIVARKVQCGLPADMDLPAMLGRRSARLLRYPVLCENVARRDLLWESLQDAGLGASAMYQHPLVEIRGVREKVQVHGDLRGAGHFAGRLLTLPVHGGVSDGHVDQILARIRSRH